MAVRRVHSWLPLLVRAACRGRFRAGSEQDRRVHDTGSGPRRAHAPRSRRVPLPSCATAPCDGTRHLAGCSSPSACDANAIARSPVPGPVARPLVILKLPAHPIEGLTRDLQASVPVVQVVPACQYATRCAVAPLPALMMASVPCSAGSCKPPAAPRRALAGDVRPGSGQVQRRATRSLPC